jgi:hypothetical protein
MNPGIIDAIVGYLHISPSIFGKKKFDVKNIQYNIICENEFAHS